MKVSQKYDELLLRYLKGYITPAQLDRYVQFGVVTKEEAAAIHSLHPEPQISIYI